MNRRAKIISLVLLFVVSTIGVMFLTHKEKTLYNFPADKTIGVWEWRGIEMIKNSIGYSEYITTLRDEHFTLLYLNINEYIDLYESKLATKEQDLTAYKESLVQLLRIARENNINVTALAGSKDWAEPDKAYLNDLVVDFVFAVNAENSEILFNGVQFDIEPYTISDFSQNREIYLINYLETVTRIRDRVRSTTLQLSFVIPYWWNKDADGSIKIAFNNEVNYVFYHLLTLLHDSNSSYLAIMNYRNYLDGSDGLVQNIKDQVRLLQSSNIRVKLYIGVETGDVQPSKITFYGTSKNTIKKSLGLLLNSFDQTDVIEGFVVHDAESYRKLTPL